jgi:hypothetical protein
MGRSAGQSQRPPPYGRARPCMSLVTAYLMAAYQGPA